MTQVYFTSAGDPYMYATCRRSSSGTSIQKNIRRNIHQESKGPLLKVSIFTMLKHKIIRRTQFKNTYMKTFIRSGSVCFLGFRVKSHL